MVRYEGNDEYLIDVIGFKGIVSSVAINELVNELRALDEKECLHNLFECFDEDLSECENCESLRSKNTDSYDEGYAEGYEDAILESRAS